MLLSLGSHDLDCPSDLLVDTGGQADDLRVSRVGASV